MSTCKKKNHVVYRYHYPFPPMHETKILDPLEIDGIYPFSKKYLNTKVKKIFQSLKYLKVNETISFLNF
jgi:hypothetical protein